MTEDNNLIYLLARSAVNDVRLLKISGSGFRLIEGWPVDADYLHHAKIACMHANISLVTDREYQPGDERPLKDFLDGFSRNAIYPSSHIFIASKPFLMPEPLAIYVVPENQKLLRLACGLNLEDLILPRNAAGYRYVPLNV